MRLVYFTHSLRLLLEPRQRPFPARRAVRTWSTAAMTCADRSSPSDAWSRANLVRRRMARPQRRRPGAPAYPEPGRPQLRPRGRVRPRAARSTARTSWSSTSGPHPTLVAAIGAGSAHRTRLHCCCFHDTHHRAVSEPEPPCAAYDLSAYDGVLAFGATLADVYRGWGWGRVRVQSGTRPRTPCVFQPPDQADGPRRGRRLGRQLGRRRAYGRVGAVPVRPRCGPPACRWTSTACVTPPRPWQLLDRYGVRYHGWLRQPSAAPERVRPPRC